jgi:hypothetical protein
MFTLVKYGFLTRALAYVIKEILFFDMKENKSINYSRKQNFKTKSAMKKYKIA